MKLQGILNSHISKVLADLGHTDYIVIADAGLPVPQGVLKIDLALRLGVPSFEEVVSVIKDDMKIEKVTLASEIKTHNFTTYQYMKEQFSCENIELVTHEKFKELTQHAKAIIRTGEATPYANCILQSGVTF
ncbi:D-ribose pyranase [Heyndrickxia oleronia]|uniref:D-ribose pyranase n=1 Tax=Heyndrickxia oleronia TaxID=38875 RepID=UPI00203D2832|nr:D-ribose pyranase [Heyndrickxia oleronia]MCM3236289.1 D-ribose pyranase [Heyndrickxia oleronia]